MPSRKGKRNISASELSTYIFCPYSWWLTRQHGVPQTIELLRGKALHKPLIMVLEARALEVKGYGKMFYSGHDPKSRALYARSYGLVGKPDYIMRKGRRMIPVETKSTNAPDIPYRSHKMQLIAYCILTEAIYSKPKFGLIKYKGADPVEVGYEPLKQECIELIAEIHEIRKTDKAPIPEVSKRCFVCSQRTRCVYHTKASRRLPELDSLVPQLEKLE